MNIEMVENQQATDIEELRQEIDAQSRASKRRA